MNEVALTDHGFPAEWCLRQGEEVADLITKGESPTWQGFSYQTNGVLFVTSENVRDGFLDVSTPKYISRRFDEKLYRSRLREGDVLINLVGASIGRSCVVPNDIGSANINQAVCLFRPSSLVCTNYISSYLQLPQVISRLLGEQVETARANVSLRDIRRFPFVTPILPEQKKIARILTTLDNLIEKTEALIAKYQAIKQGMMHDLFTRGVDSSGQLRPTHAQAPDLYKPSELGPIPKEWNSGIVENVLSGRPKNGYSPQEGEVWTGTMMLGLGCLTRNGFSPLQLKYAPPNDPKLKQALLSDGDVLISRSNTTDLVGLVGCYKDIGVPCIYSDLMMRLVPNHEVSGAFLEQLLMFDPVRRQLTNAACGTSGSMKKINSTMVLNTKVVWAQEYEQQEILRRLEPINGTIRQEQMHVNKLRQQKSGLMQDLLTGKVRVKADEAEEVAANA